jgi:hypothetical protein
MTPARRLATAALLSAVLMPEGAAQVKASKGTIDSLRPCTAAAAILPSGAQVVHAPVRAEYFPAGRQTVIESLPDTSRRSLPSVRSLIVRTSTWHTGTEAQPSASLELRVASPASPAGTGGNGRFILLLDGRSTDLGELRERAIMDSTGRELGLWSLSASLSPPQFRSLVRASRVGIAAGRNQTSLTALERESAKAVFVRAVCGRKATL